MSGDPEREYFADGMVEEIITALSRFRQLFVIARNSTFAYKGHAVDVRQVGHELGVRYVLEGSVRKSANHVRIAAQLIDATTSAHLWADRFDGGIDDIFDLQDRVAGSVVGAITPRMEAAEIERAKRKPTDSLDAYDYFLRATARFHHWTKEATGEALGLCYKAIQLDPDFASAYALAAFCYMPRKINGWMTDRGQEVAEAKRLALRAAELGGDEADALVKAGYVLARVVGELEGGAAYIDRALALNPNLATAWHYSGWTKMWQGRPEAAIQHLATAMRLSPLDPFIDQMQAATALAHFSAGRYDEASIWAEMSSLKDVTSARIAAASNALAGRIEKAHVAMARVRQLDPDLPISNLKDRIPTFWPPEDLARYEDGLRKAGLPE